VDVRLAGAGRVPRRPVLHVGAASLTVHARPLAGDLVRLGLEWPLPLRIGDRAVLRDPGSRDVWGVRVVDPAPPPLVRRGAARERGSRLAEADGTAVRELDRRGVTSRGLLSRIGATGGLPDDTVTAGDWVVSARRAGELRARLAEAVLTRSCTQRPGVPLAELTRLLDLPDDRLTAALVAPPLRRAGGEVRPSQDPGLPAATSQALEQLRNDLRAAPFAAPEAGRLADLGLTSADLAVLVRAGQVLRLADTVVLLPDAADRAVAVLAGLPQPFTVAQARAALGSSRRVVLPLLHPLDRAGRTVRLPDDRRRLR
ncbi:MAG: SelB C-terminal domain-containing protein, partial [Nocardioidaceae bacterium]